MKVVILCGGKGTRFKEETEIKPKPLIEIGGRPILWHIMKLYSHYGFNDFILCLGYKGYLIKEYFKNYFLHSNDLTINIKNNSIETHSNSSENWKITLVDTGLETQTAGRIKRIKKYIGDETFMLTYGDGVGDVNIKELVRFHQNHGKLVTLTAVQPEGKYGALGLEGSKIVRFTEKNDTYTNSWINGGFLVMEPKMLDYIEGDNTSLEINSLEKVSKDGELMAHFHKGFWKSMDKLVDKIELEKLWNSGNVPWKIWTND